MAVIKCEKGHFYDDSKYEECPHCKDGIKHIRKEDFIDDMGESKTIPIPFQQPSAKIDTEQITVALGREPVSDEGVTIGAYSFSQGVPLLAGWLVVTEGPAKGRDYRLFYGWNKIGRSVSMDIYIPDDQGISKENHASIVYEEKKNKFYLVNQSGSITYYNDRLMTETTLLENGDKIQMGESVFVFIKFCTEERKW